MSLTTQANTGSRPALLDNKRRRKWVTMTPLFNWEGTTSMDPGVRKEVAGRGERERVVDSE